MRTKRLYDTIRGGAWTFTPAGVPTAVGPTVRSTGSRAVSTNSPEPMSVVSTRVKNGTVVDTKVEEFGKNFWSSDFFTLKKYIHTLLLEISVSQTFFLDPYIFKVTNLCHKLLGNITRDNPKKSLASHMRVATQSLGNNAVDSLD